jgi:hypothetical protein
MQYSFMNLSQSVFGPIRRYHKGKRYYYFDIITYEEIFRIQYVYFDIKVVMSQDWHHCAREIGYELCIKGTI